MAKTCNHEGCENPIWSKGMCKWHVPKKKSKTSALKPRNKSVEYKGLNDLGVDKEVELYKILWENEEHISFLSGKPIPIKEGSSFWYNIFAHVLAKGKAMYPNFKLYSKNIVFLTPEEHFLLDHSSEDKREQYAKENNCSWDKLYELKEELKEEYKTIFS